MGRLEEEARTAATVLLKQGPSRIAVARVLGVTTATSRGAEVEERWCAEPETRAVAAQVSKLANAFTRHRAISAQ